MHRQGFRAKRAWAAHSISAQHRPTPRAKAESLEVRRLLAVLTVNSNADSNIADSILTLREAIEVVNGTLPFSSLSTPEKAQVIQTEPLGTRDTIDFDIPSGGVEPIVVLTTLPTITRPVLIDGYSEPGTAPATTTSPANILMQLDGGPGAIPNGILIAAQNVTVRGLAIDNFSGGGILTLQQSGSDVIAGDYLGVAPDGVTSEGNGSGVVVQFSTGTIIGGTTPADRNVISGNDMGIYFAEDDPQDLVEGNYIGTDATGASSLGNDGDGIAVFNAPGLTIGGTSAAAHNIISGNSADGIDFIATQGTNVHGGVVEGNYIGTDLTGMLPVPNGSSGVEIAGGAAPLQTATQITIGGSAAGAGNVISANQQDGIYIHTASAQDNTLQGNVIGANVAGTGVLPNFDGIFIDNADSNLIGGAFAGAGNLISGNMQDGIEIDTGSSNAVQGNRIGVLNDGVTAAGNGVDGISIEDVSAQNVIGGDTISAGNLIADNGRAGVEISSLGQNVPTQNSIRFNSIDNNGGLGIDLDVGGSNGVTQNDNGDSDSGANDFQNFPIITSASVNGSAVSVAGNFNSLPNASFTLDFYGSEAADPSGNGEGKQYLGSINVNTDATGDAAYSGTFNTSVGSNDFIAATATKTAVLLDGDTSEFSPSIHATIINPPPTPVPPSNAAQLQAAKSTLLSLQTTFKSRGGKQATIKKLLASTTHLVSGAAALVKKQTTLTAQYNKEATLIAALQAQLAGQIVASAKAKIQKKINADTAAQTRFANQNTSVSNAAIAALNNISAAETNIESLLSAS